MLKDSNPMKQYLLKLHPTLNTQLYLNNNKHINAKDILQFVNKNLLNITKHSHNQFQKEFQKCTQITLNNISVQQQQQRLPNQMSTTCTVPIRPIIASYGNIFSSFTGGYNMDCKYWNGIHGMFLKMHFIFEIRTKFTICQFETEFLSEN